MKISFCVRLLAIVVIIALICNAVDGKRRRKQKIKKTAVAPAPLRSRREVSAGSGSKKVNSVQTGSNSDLKTNTFAEEIPVPVLAQTEKEKDEDSLDLDYEIPEYTGELDGADYYEDQDSDLSAADTFWWYGGRGYPRRGYGQYIRRRGWWPAGSAHNKWW